MKIKPLKANNNLNKVLITGATGYIGSRLAIHLVRMGFEVHVLIRLGSDLSLLKDVTNKISIHQHDGSTEGLIRIMREVAPETIYHLASLFLAHHNSPDVSRLITSNVLFPTQLLEAMVEAGVKQIVNTGTSWQHFNNEQRRPVNLYAATKQAFEDILEYYCDGHKIKAISLILFDTYGPNDPRKKLITLLWETQASQKPLPMSPGEQLIDIVYIDDIINAFLKAGERLQETELKHERYGVSSGCPITLKKLVKEFEKSTGFSVPILWGKRSYRSREVMTTWTKYAKLPNWHPKHDFTNNVILTRRKANM